MTLDLYSDMLQNDGEAYTHGDTNDAQRFLWARLSDQVLRTAAHSPVGGFDPDLNVTTSTSWLYALHGGAGYVIPGASVRSTTIRAGTVLQQFGSGPSGTDATFLPYSFVDNDFSITHSVGDPSNPRIDLIACQLSLLTSNQQSRQFKDAVTGAISTQTFFKKRKVNALIQVVQGTPAAVPTYPNLPSGYAALAAVYVPANHNSTFSYTHIRDLRIPLGTREVMVSAKSFAVDTINPWAYANTLGEYVLANPSHGPCTVYLPTNGQRERVIAVGLFGLFAQDGLQFVKLYRYTNAASSGVLTRTELFNLTPYLANVGGAVVGYRHATLLNLSSCTSGTTRANPNGAGLGDPIWANGHYAGPAQEYLRSNTLPGQCDRLVLEFDSSNVSRVWFVKFFLAGGL